MMENSNMRLNKETHIDQKDRHVQWRSMSVSSSQGRTHATPDEYDLRLCPVEAEHENKHHQGKLSKTGANFKDSGKGMNDDGFKFGSLCMCLPGFGKAKAVKARKRGIQIDHSMNHPVVSSTFSLESFELDSKGAQGITVQENNEDNSISSYFELPSIMLKCNGDGA
ncbi:hypothetical protein RJT34_14742 [Clitoria ternatea]|uniref:Uncharacterized protein n=1 Tax=Clitoria ternatea TaxID=43366 RepID=A0AAN9JQX0_CLITE